MLKESDVDLFNEWILPEGFSPRFYINNSHREEPSKTWRVGKVKI